MSLVTMRSRKMSSRERLSASNSNEKLHAQHAADLEGEGRALRARALVNCVDEARPRVNSLDRHNQVIAKILKLFRASSDESVERPCRPERGEKKDGLSKSRSADSSTNGSQHARRFMRIVRDENAPPPECLDDNPYRICRYTQKFLETHYSQKSADEDLLGDKPSLPYTTSGHTILKKSSGEHIGDNSGLGLGLLESGEPSPSSNHKRATFFSEVEVIEYDMKDKVNTTRKLSTHVAPLRDSVDEGGNCAMGELGHQPTEDKELNKSSSGLEEVMVTDDVFRNEDSKTHSSVEADCTVRNNLEVLGMSDCHVGQDMNNMYRRQDLQSVFTPIVTINREAFPSTSKVHEPVIKHVRLADAIGKQVSTVERERLY